MTVWTWGEITQELINCGSRYGPVHRPYQKVETRDLRGSKGLFSSGRSVDLGGTEKPLNRQGLWQLRLQKGIPWDLMDGLPTKKLEQLVQKWAGREITFGRGPGAPALVNFGGGMKKGEDGEKLNPPLPQGEGEGGVYIFVRQLTCNNKGDLLITVAIGPKRRPVTFFD